MVDEYYKIPWTIDRIERLGFKLIVNEKGWCHFRGKGFDVHINLDTTRYGIKGNWFNFHSYKSNFKGNFRAVINNEQEFILLLNMIQ